MNRTCEHYYSCGLEFCMYDVECPEYQKKMKPILFNTEMIVALMEDRKTRTRRLIKPKYSNTHFMFRTSKYGIEFVEMQNDVEGETFGKSENGSTWHKLLGYIKPKPPYQTGDILYVRETWWSNEDLDSPSYSLHFKADYTEEERQGRGDYPCSVKWKPSLHMPKEIARIFLKVTSVRAERINEISADEALLEGITCKEYEDPIFCFSRLWNSTIKKADFAKYSWYANPWVWVIEFERCDKPGGGHD